MSNDLLKSYVSKLTYVRIILLGAEIVQHCDANDTSHINRHGMG